MFGLMKKEVISMSRQLSFFDNHRTMILTLKEEYFNQILNGVKKHEFRFKFPVEDVTAYIYLPTPVKKIVGVMELKDTLFVDIEEVSQFYAEEYKLPYNEMYDWIYPRKGCYGSNISNLREFAKHLEYKYLRKQFNFTAPQQYMYVDGRADLLKCLRDQD